MCSIHIGRSGRVLPVGKEYFFTRAISSGGHEATVAGFLAEHGGDARAILGKNDQGDAKAEVFEIEASAEEIIRHVIFKEEICDLLLDIGGTLAGIVLETLTVAHFGVPLLAGGQRFIGFNLLEDVVGHEVVRAPRDVLGVVIQLNRRQLPVLLEERGGVRYEYRAGLQLWYIDHRVKTKIHILQILLQRYGFIREREKTGLSIHYLFNHINH